MHRTYFIRKKLVFVCEGKWKKGKIESQDIHAKMLAN